MFNTKSLLFISLTLLALWRPILTQSLSDPQEVLCASATFLDVCPEIYDPVCVASPKECSTTPCYQTREISSGCEACKTEGVQSYTPGKCQYTCDAGNLPPAETSSTSGPVCASYLKGCLDASCRSTFESSTVACQDPDIVSFSLGECPDEDEPGESDSEYSSEEECLFEEELAWNEEEFTLEEEHNLEEDEDDGDDGTLYCDPDRPYMCHMTMMRFPVCVTKCLDGDCRRTAASACAACSDPNVLAYTPGECGLEKIRCPRFDLSATNMPCTMEHFPVCGYNDDCRGMGCGMQADNPCMACNYHGKDYYTHGVCGPYGDSPK